MPSDEAPSIDEVLRFAMQTRPDAGLLNAALDAREADRQVKWREFVPDLFFALKLSSAYSPTVQDVSGPFVYDQFNKFNFGVALGLRWNLNFFSVAARALRADAQVRQQPLNRMPDYSASKLRFGKRISKRLGKRAVLLSFFDAVSAAEAWLNQVSFQYDRGLPTLTT